jgi:hypothetical protein
VRKPVHVPPAYHLLCTADEVSSRHSAHQRLLERFAAAVEERDARALSAFVSNSMAGWTQQRLAAARIIAGLTSAGVIQLHDLAQELCQQAATNRWVVLGLGCC